MRLALVTLLLGFCVSPVMGQSTDWAHNRVLGLEKLTVGPWDNYNSVVSEDDKLLLFTRDLHQVQNIYQQDTITNQVVTFFDQQGDAKEARFSPNNSMVAYTYYGNDALGDICIFTLADKSSVCVTPEQRVSDSPFWINDEQLGFLSHDAGDNQIQLRRYTLKGSKTEIVYEGDVNAPVVSPDRKKIIFISSKGEQSLFHSLNLDSLTLESLPEMDLPGKTGYATFSLDGKYYYFNHYLNDSNGDQRIDGNDHSVVFRLSYAEWLKEKERAFPEQLISVENNCSFPAVSHKYLYVTCAYEGSLDIYRLPLSGSIPLHWSEKQLWEAHTTARSYAQRLLILNRIKYQTKREDKQIYRQLLGNYVQIGDFTSSRFYLSKLLGRSAGQLGKDETFYRVLEKLFEISALKTRIPKGEVTARYQTAVKEIESSLIRDPVVSEFKELIEAYVLYELELFDSAREVIKRININKQQHLLQKYITFQLTQKLFADSDSNYILQQYRLLLADSLLPEAERLFYAYEYLGFQDSIDVPKIQIIDSIRQDIRNISDPRVIQLFESELLLKQLISKTDEKQKTLAYVELTQLLKANKRDVSLRHAMHSRAIRVMGEKSEFKYLELLSRHWLLITDIKEVEFGNVSDQYSVITMDKAYGLKLESALNEAYGVFYSAIRQTNDLEAHYQFITLGLAPGSDKLENLNKSYAVLAEQKLLGEADFYVKAMRSVYEMELRNKYDVKVVDEAIKNLEAMRSIGQGAAMRDLLLGYLHHIKLRHARSGYTFDKTLYQKAHYHYIMALDLGKMNGRLLPVALTNLAWLQLDVRQYGLSESYFQQRLLFPFESKTAELSTRWALAKVLFYTNQFLTAVEQLAIAETLVESGDKQTLLAVRERRALNLMYGQKVADSIVIYRDLIQSGLDGVNLKKIQTALAYSLRQTGDIEGAISVYQNILTGSGESARTSTDDVYLLPFYPQRLQLLAHGNLAQLEADPLERLKHLSKRIEILEGLKGKTEQFSYSETSRLQFVAKDYQSQAVIYEKLQNYPAMFEAMDSVLRTGINWELEEDDPLGTVIYRIAVNYLTLAIQYPSFVDSKVYETLSKQVEKMNVAYNSIQYRTRYDTLQQLKLAALMNAFVAIKANKSIAEFKQLLEPYLASDWIIEAKNDHDENYKEIMDLISGLERRIHN